MRKVAIIILLLTTIATAKGQTSIAFQHLGNATFQNNLINPSLIPEGKLFIGLPVLSGIHFNVNSKVGYNDVFTKQGDSTLVDVSKMVGKLQRQNMFSTKIEVNILHIGYRLTSGPLLSFTINERVEGDFLYPKEMVEYVFTRGNNAFLNEDVKVSKIGLRASHFREFGLGMAAPVNDHLTVGIRGKFLVGFANVSVPGNVQATLRSNGEAFQLEADWKNVSYRTSGLDIYDGKVGSLSSHLLMNGNKGFAIDIGGTYELNKYYTLTGSIVDIGFITWKENIENEVLADTSFVYGGVDLDQLDNIQQTLEDSLFDKFKTTKNFDSYKTWLPITAQGSWIYHYSPKTDFYITANARWVQRHLKMAYGGGVTQKFGRAFTGSLSVTKLPQQFFNAGVAFTAKGGPVQMYMAVDQVVNFNVPEAQAIDFRFGMNFVIGHKQEKALPSGLSKGPIQGAKGLDTDVFLGKKVKTKKRDGIYSIIKKQKRRELKNNRTKKEGSIQTKSLTGRSGKTNTDNE